MLKHSSSSLAIDLFYKVPDLYAEASSTERGRLTRGHSVSNPLEASCFLSILQYVKGAGSRFGLSDQAVQQVNFTLAVLECHAMPSYYSHLMSAYH